MASERHILVPIDFSAHAETAAHLAVRIAERVGVGVKLMHVSPPSGAAVLSIEPVVVPPTLWDEVVGERVGKAEAQLAELKNSVSELDPKVSVEAEVVVGTATNEILSASESAEMIVMGSHGATGAERLFFGSVAEVVSRTARCPVLVARAREQDYDSLFERVVVGVDLGPNSEQVARLAKQFVAKGGTLEMVFVHHGPLFGSMEATADGAGQRIQAAIDEARKGAISALDELASKVRDDLVGVETFLETGRVEDVLLERAENAGLVVVGAHSRELLRERVLGTTADRVLRHSQTPVLLLPLHADEE
jgi:nucleotide-binding universal stress UspA family protein